MQFFMRIVRNDLKKQECIQQTTSFDYNINSCTMKNTKEQIYGALNW